MSLPLAAAPAAAAHAAHDAHTKRVAAVLSSIPTGAGSLSLDKSTSNLFRDRTPAPRQPRQRLDLRGFDHVLEVNAAEGWVDVEGLTTYEALVDATLPHGVMPAVVPQLKTITIGGAVAGVGIEATSFRHGLVHDAVLEIDVLTPDGRMITCTPHNEHSDLFHGFPNSYGTLGYALRVRSRTIPVQPYVRVEHHRINNAHAFFAALGEQLSGDADFLDGVAFDASTLVLSEARFVDALPAGVEASDYTWRAVYYKSLLKSGTQSNVDHLTAHDYIWRWDTDWFWCSKNVGAQNPLLRSLYGRDRLNSRTYTRIMRWNSRAGLTRIIAKLRRRKPESVIQDVDIPLNAAEEFLAFLLREIRLLPIWICPIRAADPAHRFPLYPLPPHTPFVNFGFWDVIDRVPVQPDGHYNRLIEREAMRLGGIKSLYSDSYFTREEFNRGYGREAYDALKARYDPSGRALDYYDKCVLKR